MSNHKDCQRKYVARRLSAGWKRFATLLPEEVYKEIQKFKELRMAEWKLRQLKGGKED